MPEVKIVLEVDDKGSIKIKQFGDESQKAFKQMTDGPKQAQGPLDSLKESWIGLTAKFAVAAAAIYAAKRMFYDTAVQIASMTNEIGRQAGVLGISTDEFQKWQYAAKMSDVNAQELAIGIKMLSRNMEDVSSGAGDTAKYFSAMGVSVKTTEGHLRPLDEVMGDIMDKFASWEDGPRKIAIALQLFGRSGETLIPLLNKGKAGFNEFAEEARKLGIILSPELIQKGSEAEDQFKKLEAQITATKLSLAPAALQFSKAIGWIVDDLKKLFTMEPPLWIKIMWGLTPVGQAGVAKGWLRDIDERIGLTEYLIAQEKKLGIQPETPYRRITDPKDKTLRVKPPAIGEKPKTKEEEFDPRTIVDQVHGAIAQVTREYEALGIAALEANQKMIDVWDIKEPDIVDQVRAEIAQVNREYEGLGIAALEANQEMVDAWGIPSAAEILAEINKVIAGEEALGEAAVNRQELVESTWRMEKAKINEIQTLWENLAQGISSSWSQHVTNIVSGAESMREGLKNIFEGIADAFASEISKMIAKWLIFDSLQKSGSGWGTKEQSDYGGLVRFIGTVVGGLLHEGGIVPHEGGTRSVPLTAFAFAPRFHTGFMPEEYPAILKKGEGVFTPDQMKALGGDTHNYYNIDARGAQRGVSTEIMRAIKESENRAVIRSVNKVADEKLRGGKYSKIFKD